MSRGKSDFGLASMSVASAPPVPPPRLNELALDACTQTFTDVTAYDHSRVEAWNTSIINLILGSLVEEAPKRYKFIVSSTIIQQGRPSMTSSSRDGPSLGDHVSTSQIKTEVEVEDLKDDVKPEQDGIKVDRTSTATTSASSALISGAIRNEETSDDARTSRLDRSNGHRGIHSATAGYWNVAQDGMWTFKHDATTEKGIDVVVVVIWIMVNS